MGQKMDEKEKIYAEIETRLGKFNDTINELKKYQERKGIKYSKEEIDMLIGKHDKIKLMLNDLKGMEKEKAWKDSKAKLEQFAKDVDKDLREAMTHAF